MAETLMQMYETMTTAAQQELYDFALFLISKQKTKRASQKTPSENYLEMASKIHGNSNGQKWTRDELYER